MITRLEVRSVHESTIKSPTNTPLWLLPRLPHEEAHHSTHAYLASFRSIHSSCLIIKHSFQVVHDRRHGYSNSFVNPAGVYRYTHMTISYRQVSTPFKGCRRGCSPQYFAHSSVLVQGGNCLSSKPNWNSRRIFCPDLNHCSHN